MENEEIQAAYTEFQNDHPGFVELLVLSESGEQLFTQTLILQLPRKLLN